MFRRFKYWLLNWLTTDICRELVKRNGYVYFGHVRTCGLIDGMAREAYGLEEKK